MNKLLSAAVLASFTLIQPAQALDTGESGWIQQKNWAERAFKVVRCEGDYCNVADRMYLVPSGPGDNTRVVETEFGRRKVFIINLELDCKRGMVRASKSARGEFPWAKPKPNSYRQQILDAAC